MSAVMNININSLNLSTSYSTKVYVTFGQEYKYKKNYWYISLKMVLCV